MSDVTRHICQQYDAGQITQYDAAIKFFEHRATKGPWDADDVRTLVHLFDMYQINDPYLIEGVIDALVRDNPEKARAAQKNEKAVGWFVGQVMACTNKRANPEIMGKILKEKLVMGGGMAA